MPETQGDVLTCLACGEKGVGVGFAHDCDPLAARRERRRCAAYVYDRAHQYINSSGIHAALCEVAHELEQGLAREADVHGELDDLKGKLPPMWGVFDTWDRRWCPRRGTEEQMGAHAVKLNRDARRIVGSAEPPPYRYQPLPLPAPVGTKSGA